MTLKRMKSNQSESAIFMDKKTRAHLDNDLGMPIKPENKNLYPKNWEEIRNNILLRAQNRCEICSVQNLVFGWRNTQGKFIQEENRELMLKKELGFKIIRIVLTVAHLDHNPRNNLPDNLKALCQKCHFEHDRKDNLKKRTETLKAKRSEQINLL